MAEAFRAMRKSHQIESQEVLALVGTGATKSSGVISYSIPGDHIISRHVHHISPAISYVT